MKRDCQAIGGMLEEEDGRVRRAEFVPYAEACKRVISTISVPLRDWLTESRNTSRIYSAKDIAGLKGK